MLMLMYYPIQNMVTNKELLVLLVRVGHTVVMINGVQLFPQYLSIHKEVDLATLMVVTSMEMDQV